MQAPLLERLLVHGTNVGEALSCKVEGKVAGYKTAGTRNDDEIVFLDRRIFFYRSSLLHVYITSIRLLLPQPQLVTTSK